MNKTEKPFEEQSTRHRDQPLPFSGMGITFVVLGFLMAEGEFLLDYWFLYNHHLHVDRVWLYQLMLVVAFTIFLRGWWNGGLARIGKEIQNYSVLYFSIAFFFLLLSTLIHHDVVMTIGRAKATIAH